MKIEELIDILNEEKEKVVNLIGILRKKRKFLEKKDIDGLKKILTAEKQKVDELESLEKSRSEFTRNFAEELGVEPTVSAILEKTEEPYRHDLTLIAARLTESLNEVSLLNIGIQQMIAYRMEEFDLVMEMLRGKRVTYDDSEKSIAGTIFNGRA